MKMNQQGNCRLLQSITSPPAWRYIRQTPLGSAVADLFIPPWYLCGDTLAHVPPLMVWLSKVGLLLLHLFNTLYTLQLNDFAQSLGTRICRMQMGERCKTRMEEDEVVERKDTSLFSVTCLMNEFLIDFTTSKKKQNGQTHFREDCLALLVLSRPDWQTREIKPTAETLRQEEGWPSDILSNYPSLNL